MKEKLFITINYTQQVGDKPIWNNGDVVEINVENKDLYLPFVVTDAQRIDNYKSDKERYISQSCHQAIDKLCDKKQLDAKRIIAGKNVSTEQDTRYQSIAKHARNATGRNSAKLQQVVDLLDGTMYATTIDAIVATSRALLQPLAEAEGKTIEEYADYIVSVEYIWSRGIDSFYIFIEEFRKFAYSVLAVDDYANFDEFWKMMDDAFRIGESEEDLTPEEIIQLIRDQLDALKGVY